MNKPAPTESASAFNRLLKSTGVLARKRAELAKLETTTLPALYLAAGRHLQASENLPAALLPLRDTARRVAAGLDTAAAEAASPPIDSAKTTAQKAKSYLAKASGQIAATTAHVRLSAAQIKLGAAAAKSAECLVTLPQSIQSDLAAGLRKSVDLKREIEMLGTANSIRAITPKRLLIAGAAAAACLLLAFLTNLSSGSPYAGLATAMRTETRAQMTASRTRTPTENDEAADTFNARFTRMAKSSRVPRLEVDPAINQVLKTVRLKGPPSVEARYFGPHLQFFVDVVAAQSLKRWSDGGMSVWFLNSAGQVIGKEKLFFKTQLDAGASGIGKFSTNDFDVMASVTKFRLVLNTAGE